MQFYNLKLSFIIKWQLRESMFPARFCSMIHPSGFQLGKSRINRSTKAKIQEDIHIFIHSRKSMDLRTLGQYLERSLDHRRMFHIDTIGKHRLSRRYLECSGKLCHPIISWDCREG